MKFQELSEFISGYLILKSGNTALAAGSASSALGQGMLVPCKGLKAVGHPGCLLYKQLAFFSAQVK